MGRRGPFGERHGEARRYEALATNRRGCGGAPRTPPLSRNQGDCGGGASWVPPPGLPSPAPDPPDCGARSRRRPRCPGIGVIAEEGRRRHPLCPGIGALARMRRYETVDGDKPPRSASLPRSLRMKKTEVESLPSKKTWHHLLAWLSAPASEPATEQIPAAPRTQSPAFVDKTGGRFAPGTQSPAFVDKTGSVLPRDCNRLRSRTESCPESPRDCNRRICGRSRAMRHPVLWAVVGMRPRTHVMLRGCGSELIRC